jgi:alpha-glucosidase (family GH31 glycosyl hydrolase)
MNLNIPFLTSSRGWGLLFDNPWPGYFDLANTTPGVLAGSAESGPLRLYFIQGPDLHDVLERYAWLTGRPPLPPRWALGYLQSKFGYGSRSEVETLVGQFRSLAIPLDAVILDLYWYGQPSDMGRMDWNAAQWPNPAQMMANMLATGVRTVLIEEPYLITSTANYTAAAAQGFVGRTGGGAAYPFSMWAGTAGLIDFSRPGAADWWWNLHRPLLTQGVAGWWLDLGEPEAHPDDMVHASGPARGEHNVYNLRWLQGLYDRQRADRPGQRVFLLTRSGFAGMQRTGAINWSGDVQKTFPDLAVQVPMLLGMGLSGVGWHNSDIGGFTGFTTAELYVRWMQFGAFCPLTRAHGSGQATEPWAFGATAQAICQKFLQLRQRLIPYSYTLAREYSERGVPLARPLLLEYPQDAQAPLVADEYLWGSSFLVAPVTVEGATWRNVYLPSGQWTNYWSNQVLTGGQTIAVSAPLDQMPLLVRSGSIVPMQNVMPSSASFPLDTLTLDIFPSDTASFTLYEDDGASYAYETGASAGTPLAFGADRNQARIHIGAAAGAYAGQPASRTWLAHVRHVPTLPTAVRADGSPLAWFADSTALAGSLDGWRYDAAGSRLIVKVRRTTGQPAEIAIDGVRLAGVATPPVPPPFALVLTASPNPATGVTTLRFSTPPGDARGVRLEVFDLRGRRVADLSRTLEIAAGVGTARLTTLHLPQGVYYVLLKAGRREGRFKLAVLH